MIGFRPKTMFFDSKAVTRRVDAATRKVLSRFGAFVRTAAQSSIKKAPYLTRKKRGEDRTDHRTKTSTPGQPPYSQTGLLKRFIFFGYEAAKNSVVIGPAKLNQKIGNAPEALEYGGRSTIQTGTRRNRTTRSVYIAARPIMGPAMREEQSKLPGLWADSVS